MKGGAKFKWYSIQVPYAESDDTEEEEEKLSPFSVVELHKLLSFLARSKFIYILS